MPVAADESIRRAEDPLRVARLEAADIAVLKVQPLGGVAACLRIAEQIGLPVVVSSALESSVGIAAGIALAAALPALPYACGLATLQLLTGDVTSAPLQVVDGELPVVRPEPDADRRADEPTTHRWLARLRAVDEALRLVGRRLAPAPVRYRRARCRRAAVLGVGQADPGAPLDVRHEGRAELRVSRQPCLVRQGGDQRRPSGSLLRVIASPRWCSSIAG